MEISLAQADYQGGELFEATTSSSLRDRATAVRDISFAWQPAGWPGVSARVYDLRQAFVAMDRLLDAGRFGAVYLKRPEIATVARDSIMHCAMTDYDLHAWVIMPNHVHMLITPLTNVPAFLRRLKGYSARQANKLLDRSGQAFWQDESYDHSVESAQEFRNIERYIVSNPVNAGLVEEFEAFPWSSAARAR